MSKRTPLMGLMLASALISAGCTRMPNHQGYVADETLVAEIKPGIDNRDSVARTLGRPTIAAQWEDQRWYYFSRDTTQLAFLLPKPVKQMVLVVSFDDKGNVANVERRGLEKVVAINPSNDKTPTLGRDRGLLDDIFGNIGTMGSAPAGPPGP